MFSSHKIVTFKRVIRSIKLRYYKGDKYVCPFCDYSSKQLSLIGRHDSPVLIEKQIVGGGKRYGGCHKCGSTDRDRLIYIYLREVYNIFKSGKEKSILHIAPEWGLSQILLKFGFTDYVCGDLYTEGYIYPEHVKDMNILNLPYSNDTFDLIICNHVLEHIPDDLMAMKELYRVLKKDGQAILQVPISKTSLKTFEDFSITDPEEREIVFGQFDHVRIYGQDYCNRLEKSGFNVNRINLWEKFKKYGINKDEDIFVCKK